MSQAFDCRGQAQSPTHLSPSSGSYSGCKVGSTMMSQNQESEILQLTSLGFSILRQPGQIPLAPLAYQCSESIFEKQLLDVRVRYISKNLRRKSGRIKLSIVRRMSSSGLHVVTRDQVEWIELIFKSITDGRTYVHPTWVGARDTFVSKNI